MFIMGFGKKTYDVVGETEVQKCRNCSHERPFKYVIEKSWFSLFFVDIFPYKQRNLLVCPVCSAGYKAPQNIKFTKKEPVSKEQAMESRESLQLKIKAKLESGEISHNEYIRMINLLKFETQQQV